MTEETQRRSAWRASFTPHQTSPVPRHVPGPVPTLCPVPGSEVWTDRLGMKTGRHASV